MSEMKLSMGEKIRALREKKGLSLVEVAEKAGLGSETLEGIEGGSLTPPLGQIVALANALKAEIGEIFCDSADSPFCIVRSDDRKTVTRFDSGSRGGYSYQSLGYKKQNRHMEPFLVTLAPSETFKPEPNQHPGEEILFVLEGQVEVSLSGHTDILRSGDSIYYDSSLPHVVSCHGSEPATLFAVIYAKEDILIF